MNNAVVNNPGLIREGRRVISTAAFITRRDMASPTGSQLRAEGAEGDTRLFCPGHINRCPSATSLSGRVPSGVTGIETTQCQPIQEVAV